MSRENESDKRQAMKKEVEIKDDGRTLIYYSFKADDCPGGDREKVSAERKGDKTPSTGA